MKLTKSMALVLDELILREKQTGHTLIETFDLPMYYALNSIDLDVPSIIQALEKENALVVVVPDESVKLTEFGRKYKEINLIELKEFLFKSVLVPILVSFLTSLITNGLQWLLMPPR